MTLKKKILLGQGLAILLTALVISWAVVNLISLGKATDAVLKENYRSILAAENMLSALERQDSGILLIFIGDTKTGIDQYRTNEAVFLEWLGRAKDNITITGEGDLVQAIETDYAAYRKLSVGITTARNLETVYHGTIFPLFNKIREACIKLRTLNERTMYAASARADHAARWAIWSTALVAAAVLIVALVFSLLLVQRIVNPIRHFMEASNKISQGNYAVQVPVETHDELGLLAVEINQMASQLNRYHEMNIEEIISEKNKSDAILASIEDALVVFKTDLTVDAINPAARKILDASGAEKGSLNYQDILPAPTLCELIRQIAETGNPPMMPDEKRVITLPTDGKPRHYLFSIVHVRGKERSLSRILLILKDITRLKEVERLKSEFITAASHELRTPLTTITMSIDLLMERASSGLSPKDQMLLQAAHEEVHRMKSLVSDLLDLSKIEAGRIDLQFDRVQTSALLEHVRTIFKGQLERKQIQLAVKIPEDLPFLHADANKITWVLTNLVSNALRYVGDGGNIELSATHVGSHIHICVTDDGPGIPPEYQTKIFQKFFQVGNQPGGTGLGLSICREIVRAHGGSIWVESAPEKGSTFTFTVPVA